MWRCDFKYWFFTVGFSYAGETEEQLPLHMEKKGKLYDRIVAHGKDRELQEARQQIQQLQNEVESLTQAANGRSAILDS